MAKFIIADEIDNSRTADVLTGGALETVKVYDYYYVPSATATGSISTAPCYLHSVVVAGTATVGNGRLGLFNLTNQAACASAAKCNAGQAVNVSGFIVETKERGCYIFDALMDSSLMYRLSGVGDGSCPGITITYQLA